MPDCCGLRTARGGDEKVPTAQMEEGEERGGVIQGGCFSVLFLLLQLTCTCLQLRGESH